MVLNGGLNPVHCGAHAVHLKRIGVEIWLGVEVGARVGVGGVAAVEEDLSQNGREC